MKNTALTQYHIDLGAKMVPFAGFNMPVQYSGVKEEHQQVRTAVGVFDVSHMGEFYLRGPKSLDLLEKISVNDPSKLVNGKAQYSCMTNENGGIVDDFLIYKISDEEYMLVVNASNIEKDWDWISKNNKFGVEMENVSDNMSLLAVQGPKATRVLQSLTDYNLGSIPYYNFAITRFAGIDNVILSSTGYTGAGGFEIYAKNDVIAQIWEKLFEAGKKDDIKPIGLAARDTLRLEMGFCLYGNDINDTTTPLEAGLAWITKLKDRNFIASEILRKQKETGVSRKLVAFELKERGIPRKDYEITDGSGEIIGKVTSGTMSPSLGIAIGLGYVNSENSTLGNEIFIQIRDKGIRAEIVKLPFFKS